MPTSFTVRCHWLLTSVVAEEAETYKPCADAASERGEPPLLELNAAQLEQRMVGFLRLTDRCRFEFLKLLAVFESGERYRELGCSSAEQFLVQKLSLGRSTAADYLRNARRMVELPQLFAALADGEIRWSTLSCVTRIATTESEGEWLSFAKTHTYEQTDNEVRRAIADRRTTPAKEAKYGLGNVRSRVAVIFTRVRLFFVETLEAL